MNKNTLKIAILAISLGALSSACQSLKLTDDLGFLALGEDLKPGEQQGVIRTEHCGIRVLGFGTNADLTGSVQNLRRRFADLRYLTRVRIERSYKQYLVYDRDCWVIRGLGYK